MKQVASCQAGPVGDLRTAEKFREKEVMMRHSRKSREGQTVIAQLLVDTCLEVYNGGTFIKEKEWLSFIYLQPHSFSSFL